MENTIVLFEAYVRHWLLLNKTMLKLIVVWNSIDLFRVLTGEASKGQNDRVVFCRIDFRH